MFKDTHIHLVSGACDHPDEFMRKTSFAGVDGGVIFSLSPLAHRKTPESQKWADRIAAVMQFTEKTPGFFPFFWLDPAEKDAKKQIRAARDSGIRGFKIICGSHMPEEYLDVYAEIGEMGLPLLFHCGILWDEHVSSKYNRPLAFESLLELDKLRFALAHIGWPWCDEYIALYGKFRHKTSVAGNREFEMFIDTTPGTPVIYREEALRKLYLSGYEVNRRVMFGSDCVANDYNWRWTKFWLEKDRAIMKGIARDAESVRLPVNPMADFASEKDLDFQFIVGAAQHDNFNEFIGAAK